jgi:hypothetical protein
VYESTKKRNLSFENTIMNNERKKMFWIQHWRSPPLLAYEKKNSLHLFQLFKRTITGECYKPFSVYSS